MPSLSCCSWWGLSDFKWHELLSLGLFSLPVYFLTEFKTEKQMGFVISPVLLSRFLKVSPQASPFLCTDSAQPQGWSIISGNCCFLQSVTFFSSVATYLCLHSESENGIYHPDNFLEVERGVRSWKSELCCWIIESERGLGWRNLKDHPVPTPLGTFHWTRLLRAPTTLALDTSRDEASITSLVKNRWKKIQRRLKKLNKWLHAWKL